MTQDAQKFTEEDLKKAVRRYGRTGIHMIELPNGDYVKHDDYEALRDERKGLEDRVRELDEACNIHIRLRNESTARNEALEAENEKLQSKYDERCNLIHDIHVLFWGDGADDLEREYVYDRVYYHKNTLEDNIKSLELQRKNLRDENARLKAEVESLGRAYDYVYPKCIKVVESRHKLEARLAEAIKILEHIRNSGVAFKPMINDFLSSPTNSEARVAKSECGSTCCYDLGCPCNKTCDEEEMCDKHQQEQGAHYGPLKKKPVVKKPEARGGCEHDKNNQDCPKNQCVDDGIHAPCSCDKKTGGV